MIKKFWTTPQSLFLVSLFRLFLGLTLFVFYAVRLSDFNFLFSEVGIYPYILTQTLTPDLYKSVIVAFQIPEAWLYIFHVVLVVLLLLIAFGIGGRTVVICAFLINSYFFQVNPAAVYGPDFIATLWLLYLCLMKSDRYLTLTQLIKKQKMWPDSLAQSERGDWYTTIGVRFVQIQLCVIYAYGGTEKLKGASWWRGDAIWSTLANGQLVTSDYSWVVHFPFLIAVMTFTTLLWEVYFPVLVWLKRTRLAVLVFGVLLHVGIGFSMNIVFFSLLMMISYVLFLGSESSSSETTSLPQ